MLNTGDGNPAAMHKLQRARVPESRFTVWVEASGFWQIKKLEFAWFCDGLRASTGREFSWRTVSFTTTTNRQLFLHARLYTRSGGATFITAACAQRRTGPSASMIEDCMIVQCGLDAEEDIDGPPEHRTARAAGRSASRAGQ